MGNISIRKAEISYWIGTAYESLGNKGKAQQAFRDASESVVTAGSGEAGQEDYSRRFLHPMGGIAAGVQIPASAWYYQALALQKLGESSRAQALFRQLRNTGTSQIADAGPSSADLTASYVPTDMRSRLGDAYYLAALGSLGLNDMDKARQELTEALRISPDHLMAKVALESMAH